MGRRISEKKNATMLDSDDTDSVSSSSSFDSDYIGGSGADEVQIDRFTFLDQCLDALYEKRGSTREKALTSIIEAFNNNFMHDFVENKSRFATLLYQSLNSFKCGSAKEVALAARLIGLLALTTGPGSNAQEILEESVSPISEALKSRTEISKITSLLECLAIITFVGAEGSDQTEKSMLVLWQIAHPELGPNVTAAKPSLPCIATVVSALSFLLTTLDGWTDNPKSWQESVAYFSTLLDKDDRSVRISAGEGLASIFEMESLEKFTKHSTESSRNEGDKSQELMHIQGLRGEILNQVRNLSAEAAGKGSTKKDLTSQRNTFRDILKFLEDGYCPETTMKVGGESLSTTSWVQLIQLNFLKRFLGGGFVKHMQENEFLCDVFNFNSEKSLAPQYRLSAREKRLYKSPNSYRNKARTKSLNEQRMQSQDENIGRFAASFADEMA